MSDRLTPISRTKWERFLESVGCVKDRTRGDHVVYKKPGLIRPIIFQADREIAVFIIKTNLRDLGISREDYLKRIKKL